MKGNQNTYHFSAAKFGKCGVGCNKYLLDKVKSFTDEFCEFHGTTPAAHFEILPLAKSPSPLAEFANKQYLK
ncbi:hypothetical protein MKW98_002226 [Papaver atlanticum]|uniref:Uncharacterized protein n=1 Tax=Papaver atlanticum TaxID=357466 RepID=A0AAD4X2T5_9MAGN|nr:hypothetical protein MKW98_002226 [Papaver atlanticum]